MLGTLPDKIIDAGYPDVGVLVDGKDILCETIRNSFDVQKQQHSSKMKASAFRGLSAMTPMGLHIGVTDLFLARASEQHLCRHLADECFQDLPSYVKIFADRGFANCQAYNPNLNAILSPAFLKGRGQFSPDEVYSSKVNS